MDDVNVFDIDAEDVESDLTAIQWAHDYELCKSVEPTNRVACGNVSNGEITREKCIVEGCCYNVTNATVAGGVQVPSCYQKPQTDAG